MTKISAFEELARSMVGDGGHPNVYFVSSNGVISTITINKAAAMAAARAAGGRVVVEDRKHGEVWGNAAYNRMQVVED